MGITSDGTGIGKFVSSVTGLGPSTTYYIRAHATNSGGTAYGNQFTFKTSNANQIADVDNNIYNTITILTQVWIIDNLRTSKYRNGDVIPN